MKKKVSDKTKLNGARMVIKEKIKENADLKEEIKEYENNPFKSLQDYIDREITETKNEVADLDNRVNEVESQISDVDGDDLDSRISDLSDDVASLTDKLDEAITKIEELESTR